LFNARDNSNSTNSYPFTILAFNSLDQLDFAESYNNIYIGRKVTTQVFRDSSAWMHILVNLNTTLSNAADRMQIYINGSRVTDFSTSVNPSGYSSAVNYNVLHMIGANMRANPYAIDSYFNGYLTEINFIDGQALDPLAFGRIDSKTGVWTPSKYTGTYGTNGFYLKFTDTSSNTATGIGKDFSGNGNNWTPNNISLTAGATYDSMIDTPTPYDDGGYGRGNYATLNPVDTNYGTISDANLGVSMTATSTTAKQARGTILFPSSGKFYFEVIPTTLSGIAIILGVVKFNAPTNGGAGISPAFSAGDMYSYSSNTGIKSDGVTTTAYGASFTTSDVIGVVVDVDSGTLTFYKNNVSQGIAFSGLTLSNYYPVVHCAGQNGTLVCNINFGQRPFAYTPPTGFKTLCTQNLPTPAIVNPAQFMAATTYAGTGATQTIANTVNNKYFQPDLVWIKGRSAATDHALYDSVRGATKDLVSNSTAAETTQASGLTTFGSTGFSIGSLAKLNTSAQTYVAWQWKAGDSTVTNTDGTITSQVDANPTAGFSIVSYTANDTAGATIGHGLGKAPSFIIGRKRNNTSNWQCYHTSLGATKRIWLNTTNAAAISVLPWNNTEPTTTLITLGRTTEINDAAGEQHIIYCFAEVEGFSKFGSYTGNGSADGPFVYCGVRPEWLMIKRSDSTGNWQIFDSQRPPYNLVDTHLRPNTNEVDDVSLSTRIDMLSNGFKIRSTSTSIAETNASGGTYIFAAFAEAPFKYALAR
jgi:hypothetical protein